MEEYVYCFKINPCVYESGPITLSIHKTKIGAYMVMNQNLRDRYEEWFNTPKKYRETLPMERDERWFIEKEKLKD